MHWWNEQLDEPELSSVKQGENENVISCEFNDTLKKNSSTKNVLKYE